MQAQVGHDAKGWNVTGAQAFFMVDGCSCHRAMMAHFLYSVLVPGHQEIGGTTVMVVNEGTPPLWQRHRIPGQRPAAALA